MMIYNLVSFEILAPGNRSVSTQYARANKDRSLIVFKRVMIGNRPTTIRVISEGAGSDSETYTIRLYDVNRLGHVKLVGKKAISGVENFLCQGWFAIYRGVPLLAISASGGQHLFTQVYSISVNRMTITPLGLGIMMGDGSHLSQGTVMEYVPDQYIPNKPTYFKRNNPDRSVLVPRKHFLNLKTHRFEIGSYLFGGEKNRIRVR